MDEFTAEDNQTNSTDWFEQCVDNGQKRCNDIQNAENLETSGRGFVEDEETKLGTFTKLRSASKLHSTPLTLKWLEENYEIAMGVCIPRSTLYFHYLDYCEKNDTQPVNAASFGKIIKQQFPQITTRRLGTRGQSKYNYYGIGVRETSSYYEVMYSAKGIQSSGEGKKGNVKQIVAYSPRSKLGTLLPEFPDIKEIKLPANVPEDKVLTFMMMYRTHCQRILDTVIRANFDEVQSFLLHFWQGMPQHMVPILDSQTIVLLVGVCDSILYKAIANVLMPTVLQALPESLTQVIRRFAKQLDDWLKLALDSLPKGLQKIKFDLARRFAQVLRRQTSLNHLCQAARTVIHSPEIISQMLDDWLSVDLNSIIKQTLYTMDNYSERDHQTIINLSGEYEHLMEEQAPLDSYIEWLDTMVDRCVVRPSSKKPGTLRQIARQFLLMWSCFGTRVIRDMTLHSAPSFGSFHLMHLMFDDYVLYLVETLHSQERANEFLRVIKGEVSAEVAEELLTPESSLFKEGFTTSGRSAFTPTYSNRHQHSERDSVITNARDVIGGITNISCSRNAPAAISNVTTTVGCNNGFADFDRQTTDMMTMQTSFNLSMTSGSQCGQFAPSYSQATPTTQSSVPNPDESGTYNRQIQVTLSPLYVTSGTLPITVTSNDPTRYGGAMDWGSQFSNVAQQDISRLGDQSFSQYQSIRPYPSEHSSHTYFDQQNATRSYLPFANDLQFPGISTQSDGNDVTNNNGKRMNEDVNARSYKRPTREQFSLQAQLEEGFI